LKRKKDRKLLPRAAELALVASAAALGEDRSAEVGCVLGVGREPPEEETEPALIAAAVDGRLDPARLATTALPLYPPLASLRTLPNLVLAHVAIHLGLTGESGTRAGDGAAGLAAVVEAYQHVREGRAEVMLAGGAESLVEAGAARDRVRMGDGAEGLGEAAAMVRLEPLERATARGATVWAVVEEATLAVASRAPRRSTLSGLGGCGAADGAVALVLALAAGGPWAVEVVEPSGTGARVRGCPPDMLRFDQG
jgi:3-oxoacyl-(acyl-carrier-protein) synthase